MILLSNSRLALTQEQLMIHDCTHLYIKSLKEAKTHERKCASCQQFQEIVTNGAHLLWPNFKALQIVTVADLLMSNNQMIISNPSRSAEYYGNPEIKTVLYTTILWQRFCVFICKWCIMPVLPWRLLLLQNKQLFLCRLHHRWLKI